MRWGLDPDQRYTVAPWSAPANPSNRRKLRGAGNAAPALLVRAAILVGWRCWSGLSDTPWCQKPKKSRQILGTYLTSLAPRKPARLRPATSSANVVVHRKRCAEWPSKNGRAKDG